MFSSTLRFNLDPFNEHSDQKLWDVLQVVNMKDAVSNLAGKLQEMVSEGGSNFSSGQRQVRLLNGCVYVCYTAVCTSAIRLCVTSPFTMHTS